MASPSPSIGGRTVALLEARRAQEMADLVRRYGGEPWSMPVMREAPLDNEAASLAALRSICAGQCDAIVCLTGVGPRALFQLAGDNGLETQLRAAFQSALVVVRGPKPSAALRALGVRIDRAAEPPNTSVQVLAAVANDTIRRAAVQLYGQSDPVLLDGLRARVADVLEVPVYKYAFPDDLSPVLGFFDGSRRADVLAVTSGTQVHNLFEIAESRGLAGKLQQALDGVAVASIGPVAARAIQEHGLKVAIQPEHSTMGALVREIARHYAA